MLKQKQINKTLEFSIGKLADKKVRGIKKQNKINQIISLLKQLQTDRNITDFNKNFLRQILIDFSDLKIRNRQRLIRELLDNAKNKKERVITKKFLVKQPHTEFKLKGEMTKSKRCGVDLCWVERGELSLFYSFL